MAVVRFSGSVVTESRTFLPFEKLRPYPLTSRVSSATVFGTDRRLCRSLVTTIIKPKLSVSMCLHDNSAKTPGFDANTAVNYTKDQTNHFIDGPGKSYPTAESSNGSLEMNMNVPKESTLQPKKYAKIHDFCLGIPFGGFVFGGGLFGFLFSRNPASLVTGVLLGGAILAMGVISLKVWRKGISSLPFILGQAALAATLLWKHLHVYSLTKKSFPSALYVVMSAAMLCFYSYVLISGGNPPPKKLAASPTS